MKNKYLALGVVAVLVLVTGCQNPDGSPNNTGTGALIGMLGGALAGVGGGHNAAGRAVIGSMVGALAGGLIGSMIDHEQQQRLQQNSPETLKTIEHNDTVYHQQAQAQAPQAQAPQAQPPQAQPPQAQPPQAQAPQAQTFIPLTVEDIKALAAAGVKKEAITREIEISQSKYSPQDLAEAQKASVDAAVIECMKNHPS